MSRRTLTAPEVREELWHVSQLQAASGLPVATLLKNGTALARSYPEVCLVCVARRSGNQPPIPHRCLPAARAVRVLAEVLDYAHDHHFLAG